MTPKQLAEDLERRNLAAQQALGALQTVSPGSGAIAAREVLDEKAGQALGATAVAAPGSAAGLVNQALFPQPAPAKEEAAAPPKTGEPAVKESAPESNYFLDLLNRNDAYRLANKEAFERNEKANKARTTIAAVTDALASLGNLVGTTQGAFSQPQTYQTPFVTEQVEADRARARQLADRIQANEQSIGLAQSRQELQDRALERQLAVQQAMTDRAAMNNASKIALEEKKQEGRESLENLRQGGRVSLKQMDIEYKQDKDKMMEALKRIGLNISSGRLDEMIRHNHEIEAIREKGAGAGNVGAYTTYVEYDEYGRVVKRWRVPGNSGSGTSSGSEIDWDDEGDEIDW